MPATKSGTTIVINGSPNTMSSVVSDINDVTWIDESPAGTFNSYGKQIQIQDGGVLTLGNPADYSVNEILKNWETGYNSNNLNILHGGEFQMFGAAELWMSTNLTHWSYMYWYGKFYARGNATYTPMITNHEWLIREYTGTTDAHRNHDIVDVDYLFIKEPYLDARGFACYFQAMINPPDAGLELWKHLTIGYSGSAKQCNRQLGLTANQRICGRGDFSKCLRYEDCTFQYSNNTGVEIPGVGSHFKDCVFQNHPAYGVIISGDFTSRGTLYTLRSTTLQKGIGQWFAFFEGCTFQNNASQDMRVLNTARALLKDCSFPGGTYNVVVHEGGIVYIWTGNTLSGTNPIWFNDNFSLCYYVHALDLTIQDKGGNPIENATIYIRQKDGKEELLFRTDSTGKSINLDALDGKIILIHKEQINQAGDEVYWSDVSNSTYHDIWIYAAGYEPAHAQQIMSADRNQIIELEDALTAPDVREPLNFGLGLVGELDLPVIGDVEKGVQYDSVTKTGTFKAPAEADVREGEGYGAADVEFTGELDLPVIGDVRDGIKYDSETKEGTLSLPAESNVRKPIQYGDGGIEFTGTAIIPGKADVRDGVDVDVSDVGLLDLPAIGDVEKDVQFDNLTKTGTFKVPTEPQVQKDVQYGAAGTEFTGLMIRRVVWKADAVAKLQKTVSIKGIFQEGG